MKVIAEEFNEAIGLTFVCDKKRHLICLPYSKANMLSMATELGINPLWFHKDHYDIPKERVEDILKQCVVVSPKEIVKIIKEDSDGEFRQKQKAKKAKKEVHYEQVDA